MMCPKSSDIRDQSVDWGDVLPSDPWDTRRRTGTLPTGGHEFRRQPSGHSGSKHKDDAERRRRHFPTRSVERVKTHILVCCRVST